MRQNLLSIRVVALFLTVTSLSLSAQKNLENQISDSLTSIANSYSRVGRVNVINFSANQKTSTIYISANERLGYIPFRPENVKRIFSAITKIIATGIQLFVRLKTKT